MSMKEVAVYFDVLRQRRQISQPDLAKMLGVTVRQVQRWTVEGVDGMKFDNVWALLQALRGSMEDVLRLMEDDVLLASSLFLTHKRFTRIIRMFF